VSPDQPIECDVDPPIPADLRSRLNQLMRSTTRVVVYDDDGHKVNALRLTTAPGSFPKEPLEDICREVCRIMHVAWSEQSTEDPDIGMPPMQFAISCEHTKNGKRIRPQFQYVYHGDGSISTSESFEEVMGVEEMARARTMEMLERQNQQFMGTIDLLHGRFLELVTKQSEALTSSGAAANETMKQALPMFFGGVQSMLNGKYMEYNVGRAEAAER
jgi:hypothetical protein